MSGQDQLMLLKKDLLGSFLPFISKAIEGLKGTVHQMKFKRLHDIISDDTKLLTLIDSISLRKIIQIKTSMLNLQLKVKEARMENIKQAKLQQIKANEETKNAELESIAAKNLKTPPVFDAEIFEDFFKVRYPSMLPESPNSSIAPVVHQSMREEQISISPRASDRTKEEAKETHQQELDELPKSSEMSSLDTKQNEGQEIVKDQPRVIEIPSEKSMKTDKKALSQQVDVESLEPKPKRVKQLEGNCTPLRSKQLQCKFCLFETDLKKKFLEHIKSSHTEEFQSSGLTRGKAVNKTVSNESKTENGIPQKLPQLQVTKPTVPESSEVEESMVQLPKPVYESPLGKAEDQNHIVAPDLISLWRESFLKVIETQHADDSQTSDQNKQEPQIVSSSPPSATDTDSKSPEIVEAPIAGETLKILFLKPKTFQESQGKIKKIVTRSRFAYARKSTQTVTAIKEQKALEVHQNSSHGLQISSAISLNNLLDFNAIDNQRLEDVFRSNNDK